VPSCALAWIRYEKLPHGTGPAVPTLAPVQCAVQRTEKSTLEKKPNTEDVELFMQIDAAIHV